MHQPELPFQSHSETSRAAALAAEPFAGTARGRVLSFIRSCGEAGATDEEIQLALGMNPSTQRPRRTELQGQGLIVDSGRTRETRSKRKAVVWVAVKGEVDQ